MCVSFVERWTFEERDREKERPGARIEESTEYLCVCVCFELDCSERKRAADHPSTAAPMKSSFLNFLERAPSTPCSTRPLSSSSGGPFKYPLLSPPPPVEPKVYKSSFQHQLEPYSLPPRPSPDPPAAATSAYASPPLTLLSFVKSS